MLKITSCYPKQHDLLEVSVSQRNHLACPSHLTTGISATVAHISIDTVSDRILPSSGQMLFVPQFPYESIHWGLADQSIRLHVDRRVSYVAEGVNCSCLAFADSDLLVTGSEDSTLALWKLMRKPGEGTSLRLTHMLRGHTDKVTSIAASRPWSLIISASNDTSVIFWDMNRAQYVRSIKHDTAVNLVVIQETTV